MVYSFCVMLFHRNIDFFRKQPAFLAVALKFISLSAGKTALPEPGSIDIIPGTVNLSHKVFPSRGQREKHCIQAPLNTYFPGAPGFPQGIFGFDADIIVQPVFFAVPFAGPLIPNLPAPGKFHGISSGIVLVPAVRH